MPLLAFGPRSAGQGIGDKLPKDAIVYVELSGSEHTLEGRLTTPFGRLMNDPGMKAFKDAAWEAIGKLIAKEAKSEEDAKVAKAVTDVLTHLWKQGFALSLGNIEMGQQGPDFSLAVVSPAGGDSGEYGFEPTAPFSPTDPQRLGGTRSICEGKSSSAKATPSPNGGLAIESSSGP